MASVMVEPDTAKAGIPSRATRESDLWRRLAGFSVRPVILGAVLLVLYVWVHSQTLDSIERRVLNPDGLRVDLWQHVQLSVIATALTIMIAVPLGVLLTRPFARWIKPVGLGLGNLGQAIPSIGLIVLLALWLGIGFGTAVIALVVYATLPILRNTIVGLDGVDPALKEAARGMG
ncbi:MAG TPA: ABC transporter permease subunit, partial [Dermatophilaceae bacterium]